MLTEKSVGGLGSLFGIIRLWRVMPNSDSEGQIFLSAPINNDFLSAPINHNRFFFLHTIRSPAFYFTIGVAINVSCSFPLTSVIYWKLMLYVTLRWRQIQCLNDRVTGPPIQPMYWHVLLFGFYLSHRSEKGMLDKICQHWWKSRKTMFGMQENDVPYLCKNLS